MAGLVASPDIYCRRQRIGMYPIRASNQTAQESIDFFSGIFLFRINPVVCFTKPGLGTQHLAVGELVANRMARIVMDGRAL